MRLGSISWRTSRRIQSRLKWRVMIRTWRLNQMKVTCSRPGLSASISTTRPLPFVAISQRWKFWQCLCICRCADWWIATEVESQIESRQLCVHRSSGFAHQHIEGFGSLGRKSAAGHDPDSRRWSISSSSHWTQRSSWPDNWCSKTASTQSKMMLLGDLFSTGFWRKGWIFLDTCTHTCVQ